MPRSRSACHWELGATSADSDARDLATRERFAPVLNKTPEEQAALYASPSYRDRVRPEHEKRGIAKAMVDRMRIAEAKSDPGRSHAASGRTLEEIAAESGINPLDLLRDERFMIGLSDGGARGSRPLRP